MAQRTDQLEVKFTASGDGQVKASLAGVAQGAAQVEGAAKKTENAWASMERVVGDTGFVKNGILAQTELARRLKVVADQAKETGKQTQDAMDAQNAAAGRLQSTLSRLGLGVAFGALVVDAVKTAAAYNTLDARLLTVTKSQQGANDAMIIARAVAGDLNLSVLTVGNAMADWRANGLLPTGDTLTAIANIAAATGKTFDETSDIIVKATQGSLDGLNQLGVAAAKNGDQLSVSFHGTTTSIGNDAASIVDYLNQIGLNTYGDAAAAQARTLAGEWNGLQTSASELAAELQGPLAGALGLITDGIAGVSTMARNGSVSLQLLLAAANGNISGVSAALTQLTEADNIQYAAQQKAIAQAKVRAEQQKLLADLTKQWGDAMTRAGVATAKSAEQTDKETAAGKKLLDSYSERLQLIGKTASEQTRLRAERDAAATTDKALAAQILAVGNALADQQAKQEKSTASTHSATDARREFNQALKESKDSEKDHDKELLKDGEALVASWKTQAQLLKEIKNVYNGTGTAVENLATAQAHVNSVYDGGVTSAEQYNEAQKAIRDTALEIAVTGGRGFNQLAEDAQALADHLDPVGAAMRELAHDFETNDLALKANLITLEQYNRDLAVLQRRREELARASPMAPLVAGLTNLTGGTSEESAKLLEQFGADFSRTISESALNGFKDIGSQLKGFFRNVLGTVLNSVVENFVTKPLMALANNLLSNFLQQIGVKVVTNAAGQAVGSAAGSAVAGAGGAAAGATATGGAGAAGGASLATIGWVAAIVAGMIYNNESFDDGYRASELRLRDFKNPLAALASGPVTTDRLLQSLGVSERIASLLTGSAINARLFGARIYPEIDARGSAAVNFGIQGETGIGAFGRVGVSTKNTGDFKAADMLQAILELDKVLAGLLKPGERADVTTALESFSLNNIKKPEDVLIARFNAVIAAVEPQWMQFLGGFEELEDRVKAFAALRIITDQVNDLDDVVGRLGNDALATLRKELEKLSTNVDDTAQVLATAIAANDPEAIANAAAAATEAVVARYQTEIGLAHELQAAFDAAREKAFALNLAIEQRIAGLTGDNSIVTGLNEGRIADLGTRIGTSESPAEALELLDQWIAAVDQWLEQSTAAVKARYAEQLSALDDERAAIIATAEARERELALAESIRAALAQATEQAYQLQLTLAQRMANTGGSDDVAALAQTRMGELAGQIDTAGNAEQALEALNQWIAAVDQWLAASEAEIRARYASQLTALDDERAAIIAAAEAREREQALADDASAHALALAEQIRDALAQADQNAYQLNQTLAQRIQGLTGDSGPLVGLASGRMGDLRGQIDTAANAEQALDLLNQWIAAVDQWLSASRAQINEMLAAQLAALDAQRNAILADAQARANAEQQAQQQSISAADSLRIMQQQQLDAAQTMLGVVRDWVDVLNKARALIDDLQRSSSNPLSGQGRLDALNQRIAALQNGEQNPDTAQQLIDLLQERLQLVQGEGLLQRPSGEYLALYNQTLAELARLQTLAEPKADLAVALQREIASLQGRTYTAVTHGTSVAVQLSADEQAQLDAIAAEEARVRAEAQAKLDAINAQALAYYQWAQTEAIALQEQRQNELIAALTNPASNVVHFTPEEQARLDAIAKEQTALQQQMADELAALNQQALGYYTWAQGEAVRLDAQRQQEIIDALTNGSQTIHFTPDEQARLDAIAKEQAALQQQMADELAQLNAQALSQYEWARTTAQTLEDARNAELLAQLQALTGGTPLDEFIADRTALATTLLGNIRDDLRAFLAAISHSTVPIGGGGTVPIGGGGPGGGGGGGSGPGNPISPPIDTNALPPVINFTTTINGSGLSTPELRNLIQTENMAMAGQLKREMALR